MKNFVLILIILGLAFAIFRPSAESSEPLLSGYISSLSVNSRKFYEESLLNFYPPETEWQAGPLFGTSDQPLIAGKAGVLIEINSGEVLFEHNAQEKLPIASLTKIMTAVIALEHKKLDEKVFVTQTAAVIGENSMGLTYGETYTLEEMLYGLILESGNDAAYAIAESVAGSSDRFVEWMNFKATELGLSNTTFADPSGLNDNNVSTASDLAKLTRYAMKNPEFRRVSATIEKEIPFSESHKYVYLVNQTNLLTTYPGVAGVKTGYTEAAGLCLVTYAKNGGREVVGVVLDSIDRKGDMILMLDHGFGNLGIPVVHNLL